MIVGIVIGSGIFFKGRQCFKIYQRQWRGRGFCIGGGGDYFGSLSIAESWQNVPMRMAVWLAAPMNLSVHIFYHDWLVSIVFVLPHTWRGGDVVVGIYTALLFGVKEASLELQMGIGLTWFVICYLFNVMAAVFAGRFQVFATVVKLVPLFAFRVMAFVYGDPVCALTHPSESARQATQSLAWLGAIGPDCVSFDGWVVYQYISGKSNMPNVIYPLP